MSEKQMKYQRLGKSGLNISQVVVGCLSYGLKCWQDWVIEDEEEVFKVLKKCYDSGLRTFDTADGYSNGYSEVLLGKFLKKFDIPRESVVIMSKCYMFLGPQDMSNFDTLKLASQPESFNSKGLSRNHILNAAKASVERLGTYMDVLQIHRLDDTPSEEIMKALHDAIGAGYTRYIGASTMRAVEFVELQNVAEKNGWTKFISMQNYYNLLYREEEREMNYYCNKTGVGLLPWSPNARGVLARPSNVTSQRFEFEKRRFAHLGLLPEGDNKIIIDRVEEIAKKYNTSMAAVATAWVLSKGYAPIVGISSEKRVDDYIVAVNLDIAKEDFEYLEEPYKPRALQLDADE